MGFLEQFKDYFEKEFQSQRTVQHFKTHLRSLNELCGGGIPIGKVIAIVGNPATGKSALAAQIIASAQKCYPDAEGLYIDTEFSMTEERLKALGCDVKRLMLIQPNFVEDIHKLFTFIFSKRAEKKEKLPLLVIVWDSLAFTRTAKHLMAEKPEDVTGYTSRYLSFLLNKIIPYLEAANISLITITHLRNLISFGPTVSVSSLQGLGGKEIAGGESFKYSAYMLLYLKSKAQVDSDKYKIYGNEVLLYTVKNKNYPPRIEVPLLFTYEYGFSDILSAYLLMDQYNLIESKGRYKYLGNIPFRISNIIEKYKTDIEFRRLFDETYKMALKQLREEYALKPLTEYFFEPHVDYMLGPESNIDKISSLEEENENDEQ